MPEYDVRLEKVKYAIIRVKAGSALLARDGLMKAVDNLAANGQPISDLVADTNWHDGGINVEGALEVGGHGTHGSAYR